MPLIEIDLEQNVSSLEKKHEKQQLQNYVLLLKKE
jgi:hypothetical protein